MSDEKQTRDTFFGDETKKSQQQESTLPYSELHFTYLTTEPAWGRESTADLYNALQDEVLKVAYDEHGNPIITQKQAQNLWGMLSYFTRDLRLGNLSYAMGEMTYCRFWVEFAGDCLRYGLIKSFVASMAKAITTLELSQSKGGFFRRRANTITREDVKPQEKKSLFGGGRKEL